MFTMGSAFLAQAVADAVGRPFEFGVPGREDVLALLHDPIPLKITDDTQMALFGLEALVWVKRANGLQSIATLAQELRQAYLRWYGTQTGCNGFFGLANEPLMQQIEAPGNTCMGALRHLQQTGEVQRNSSKGCGAVMRLLPFHYLPEPIRSMAADLSATLTHGHPDALSATQTLMRVYAELGAGGPAQLPDAVNQVWQISDLGEGWVAPEAVDMARWAFDRADSYEDLLLLSICHAGDSDSVAAIAGSLWGVAGRAVPEQLVARLLQRPIIEQLCEEYDDVTETNPEG